MTEPRSQAYHPFSVFAVIWAATTLIHQLAFTFWTERWPGWVLVFSAIAVLFWPRCLVRFSLLVVASLVNLGHKMPFVPNHILYEGMLHIIMLLGLIGVFFRPDVSRQSREALPSWKTGLWFFLGALVVKLLFLQTPDFSGRYAVAIVTTLIVIAATIHYFKQHRPSVPGGREFLISIAPVIRLAVIVMYFWAAIQKINRDYLNPEISCAAVLHKEIAAYFGGIVPTQTWALQGAIWGSFFFELAIPILLLIRRTRLLGFVTAVMFHLWLSIHPAAGIYSFSSLILALLFFFLPQSWGETMTQHWRVQLEKLGGGDYAKGQRRAAFAAMWIFFVTLITQGTLYLTLARDYTTFQTANRLGFAIFILWGIWFGFSYLRAGWERRTAPGLLVGKWQWTPAWIGLLLVLGNGLMPWIGLKTQTSFSMYSNLRTEGETNHLFLKRADLFPYQQNMVTLLEAEPDILSPTNRPAGIQQFANPDRKVFPRFELERLVGELDQDVRLTFRENEMEKVAHRKDGEWIEGEAIEAPPWWQRKLFWFRRLEKLEGEMNCTH